MKKVYICAPVRGERLTCLKMAAACANYAMECGTAPVVPHFYALCTGEEWVQVCEKTGLSLLWFCDEMWVFGSSWTAAMKKEIQFCKSLNIRVKHIPLEQIEKRIGGNVDEK